MIYSLLSPLSSLFLLLSVPASLCSVSGHVFFCLVSAFFAPPYCLLSLVWAFLFILSGANPFLGHAALSQEALSAVFVLLLVLNLLVSLLEDAMSSLFCHVLVVVFCFFICLSLLSSLLSLLLVVVVLRGLDPLSSLFSLASE